MKMHYALITLVLMCCDGFCENTPRKRVILSHPNVSIFSMDSAPGAEKRLSQLVNIWYQLLDENDNYVVVVQRGRQYKVRKQDVVEVSLAERYFTDQIRRDPQNADAFMRRATARRLIQDAKGAAEDYAESVRLQPNSAVFRHNQATFFLDARQFGEAITGFKEVLRLDPGNIAAMNGLAVQGLRITDRLN